MRIVIDLQVCQSERVDLATRTAVLRCAQALVRNDGVHEFRILLGDRVPYTIARLRREFPALDDAGNIVVVAGVSPQPAPDRRHRFAQVAAIIREACLRDIEPDCVIVPAGFDDPEVVVAPPIVQSHPRYATLMLWMPAEGAGAGASEPGDRDAAQAAIGSNDGEHADLIYVDSEAAAENLREAGISNSRVVRLDQGFGCEPDAFAARALRDCTHIASAVAATRSAAVRAGGIDGSERPRLAFVSPMPPEKTGVATYNARLLPALSKFYDVEVVTDQAAVELPAGASTVAVRSISYFIEHFDSYDRVLYHMGNSPFHSRVPELVRDYPGTVVLHDVYLGDLMSWLDDQRIAPGILQRSLVEGHGYGAAAALARKVPRSEIARQFECNCSVVDEANGVIVHSRFAEALVANRFARYVTAPVALATLCRPIADRDRTAARRRLDIGEGEFIVASFGFVNHIKMHDRLVSAWLASRLAADGGRLILVGEGHGGAYHQALQEQIAASTHASRIAITGYVDDAVMADYLAASDIAVQLRSETRGETSGAALDCLAYGLPLITNRCGSLAEIPGDVAMGIPFDFSTAELTTAIERLADDASMRESLGREALKFVALQHAPEVVAQRYALAIEHFAAEGPRARYAQTLSAIAGVPPAAGFDDADVDAIAGAIASNLRRPGDAQLFIDVTPLVDNDLRTGIERVTRAVVQRLLDAPPTGVRVEPVRFFDGRFVYARQFMSRWLGLAIAEEDFDVEPRSGDAFLGLAWSPHAIPVAQDVLRSYQSAGVRINFVVYDILPQQHPEWFPPGLAAQHRAWLVAATSVADRLVCISRSVADDLIAWLDRHGSNRLLPVRIAHFPQGGDIEATVASTGIAPDADQILAPLLGRKVFLMVATVEPRKGHRQVVEAFDILWRNGHDVALVVVGKRGWMTADVETRIREHTEHQRRLIRLAEVSDEFLERIYRSSDALLAASFGEGFGLPIIEGAQHGLPVIARDLAVFREVAGEGAWYFDGHSPADLATAIASWLELAKTGSHPKSDSITRRSWAESTALLMATVDGRADYKIWESPAHAREASEHDGVQCAIDFSSGVLPSELAAMSGVSIAEPWGRWSDASASASVVLAFWKPLPRRGRLSITARAFGPNCGADVKVAIGGALHSVRFFAADSTAELDFVTDGCQHTIKLTPPMPVAPAQHGLVNDGRKLGIGLVRMEVTAAGG